MVKTLLLCFIHGFKGDEETFFEFPDVCSLPFQKQLNSGGEAPQADCIFLGTQEICLGEVSTSECADESISQIRDTRGSGRVCGDFQRMVCCGHDVTLNLLLIDAWQAARSSYRSGERCCYAVCNSGSFGGGDFGGSFYGVCPPSQASRH